MTQPAFESDDAVEARAAAKARTSDGITRSVAHAAFHLERTYGARPARVWEALTDPVAKAQWFGVACDQVEIIERGMDVRPGGASVSRAVLAGPSSRPLTRSIAT